MRLKTYRAPTMADALSAVKKDLGRSATILHTRTVKSGGFLGFRCKTAIEITASDQPPKSVRRPSPVEALPGPVARADSAAALAPLAAQAYRKAAGVDAAGRPASMNAQRSEAKPVAEVAVPAEPKVLPVRQRTGTEPQARGAPSRAQGPAPLAGFMAPTDPASVATLHRELADIKLLVNQVLHAAPMSPSTLAAGAMPEALFKHYLRLLESDVSRDIADAIIGAVRDELTPGELADDSIVRTTVLRHLAGLIPVADSVVRPEGNGRPLTIALVGPTGVGKTTTIAKLAAAYRLRHGKSVALITSDTYRIAAVEQLRTYAGIIGLPIRVVMTPDEMRGAVEDFADHDVILIDSAGRSQNAADRLAELGDFLAAAAPDEVHLVLSTTASEQVLLRTAEAFAVVKPNRVILTKLDEAVNFGVVVNVARRLRTALSFVTTGQEVPDHIEPGRPDRLARMILDNTFSTPRPPTRQAGPSGGRMARGPGVSVGVDAERAELLTGRTDAATEASMGGVAV